MSDFFMSNNSVDDFKKRQSEYTQNVAAERLENRQRYGVELSDKEYAQINNLIADSENQDEEAHRIGSAILFSKQLGIPVDEAYMNLDSYTEALWGTEKTTNYRNAFTAISDMFVIGNNGLKLGNLGNKLKEAELAGDQEMVDQIYKEIDLIEQDNSLRQDNAPRSWVTEALKAGAQTLPFSAEAAGVGLFGNFIAPGVGTILAFGSSSSIASGQEYIDMRREGVTPETARKVAAISGGIQGAIEVALGTTTDYLAAGAGKKIAETTAGQIGKKVSEAFAKRFHYGAGKKAAVALVSSWTADKLGEGLEEAVQEVTSIISQDVARSMDGLGLSDETIAEKTKQVMEAFKGGVIGAIVLGLPLDVVSSTAKVKDYGKVKEAAATIGSEEMFEKAVENNPVFADMKDEKKKEIIREVWENTQSDMEAAELHEARGVAEVNTADETFENIETDEETGENNAAPVVRDELTGGLIVQDDITEDDGNIKKGSYRAGDNTKSDKNNYGYINYTIDEENKTITIDKFSMNAAREGLREEMFDNFARDKAGYNIEWDPKLKVAKDVKERLVAANPSGKNNGLNYYNSKEAVADVQTRKQVASQIKDAYAKIGKNLTTEQLAADVSILESLYNRLGRDLTDRGVNNFTDYVNYTFGNNIFGNPQEAYAAAARQGEKGKIQGASVTRTLKEFDRGMKALIYVTENGDFSTFSHEVAHIARKQMDGDLLAKTEAAFGVKEGNWTKDQEEAFAYGFEQFLRTGKAQNEDLKTIFQKIAQFLNDCMTALKAQINMSPAIEDVYNELMAGDKSTLAEAKRAAEAADADYRMQQEEEAARAEQDKYKLEQEEREANAETTDYDEELAAHTVPQNNTVKTPKKYYKVEAVGLDNERQTLYFDSLKKASDFAEEVRQTTGSFLAVQEATEEEVVGNEPTSQEEVINNALDNAAIPEAMKEEAASVLNDPEETIGAKEEVIQDVAGEAMQNEIPDALFQIIGELGATNLDRVEEVTTRMDNKKIAEEMEKAGKDAKAIRLATGWERGKDKLWRYETNDLLNKFDLINKVLDFEKKNPKYKEYSEKLWASYNGGPELTEAEIKDFDALADEANAYYDKTEVKLKDILDAPELYAAYPQLKEMDVKFVKDPLNTTKASYVIATDVWTDAKENFIQVNNVPNSINEKEYEKILLHEIQHVIQEIEGFAAGGNQESATRFAQEAYDAFEIVHFYDELEAKYKENPEKYSYNQLAALEDVKKEYADADISDWLPSDKIMNKAFNLWVRGYGIEEQQKIVKDNDLDKYVPHVDKDGYRNYKRLAGEVESRNVEKRINMSDIERLNTLLKDTEDVVRREQLVMFEAARMASEEVNKNNVEQKFNEVLNKQTHEQEVKDYKKSIYDDKLADYEIRTFTTTDGRTISVNAPKARDPYQHEIDEAAYLIDHNVPVEFLDEPPTEGGHPDLLVFNNTIAELKQVTGGKKSALNRIKEAINKQAVEVPIIFFIDNAINISDQEIVENLNSYPDDLNRNVDEILIVRDYKEVSEIKKNYPGTTYVAAQVTSNITSDKQNVNNDTMSFQTEKAQVTSDNFKKWFGDWENNLEGSSKVTDDDGRPMVVYHGTNAYIPDIKKFKKGTKGYLGPGMYFTNSIDYARRYTDYGDEGLMRLFLNIRNPLTVSTDNPAMEILQAIYGDGAEKVYKKRELKDDRITNIITKADIEKLKTAGYDGIIWNLTNDIEYSVFDQNQIKSSDANNGEYDPQNPNIYFQTAYHGTAADFDKFDTERYGLSGEGSMSFGYGTYVAGEEEIARDYAERQYNQKFETTSKISRLDHLKERIADDEKKLKVLESPEAYYAERDESIARLEKELEGETSVWKQNLIKKIPEQYTEENRLMYLKSIQSSLEQDKKELTELEQVVKEIEEKGDSAKRHLLTVEIPDKGYIKWDKTVPKSTRERVVNKLYDKLIKTDYAGAERELRYELQPLVNTALSGQDLYQDIWTYLGSDKEASKFLSDMGFAGIDYPAGTNFGTEIENARNYVIFNDDDAQIVEKLAFQTQQELYNDARSFATWTEFMDHYQNDFDPEALEDPMYHSQVPSGASAQWYQTTWELANGIQPEESLNEQEVKDKYAKEGTEPRAMDSLFVANVIKNDQAFDDFMHMVAYYENIDLSSDEWSNVQDAEDEAERNRIEQIKDLIDTTMNSEGTSRALNRIAAGGEITPEFKRRIQSEMSKASRDFRSLYSIVMDDPSYRVNPEDTVESLNEAKRENLNKRYDLNLPEVSQRNMTPRQRVEYSNELDNQEIAAKLRDGTLKMDDQVDKYINSLKEQIAEQKKMYKELQSKILEETARIADEEQQDLLKINEKLNALKLAVDKRDNEMQKKLANGLKISAKYKKESQNLKHDYNEIMRKYKDALATTKITGEVQRALEMQEKLSGALSQINKLEDERITMGDVQKLRKNLVKRAMRRVKFDTVDYDYARQIIAIQRIFEPNLLGGVNKWIGQRDPYLRGVISAVITDKDYRNELSNHIRNRATSSNAYAEFWQKWQDLITSNTTEEALKKFNSWDEKTRKRAILYLPKEDWIKELQLKELEKEREESIDLDIGIKERRQPMRDEQGNYILKPQYDENGKPIKNPERQEYYMKTIYEFDASDEIKNLIKDAVGEDIYNNLLYRPFNEWTVEEMENLAKRIDDLYTEGRDILAAKKQLQVEKAAAIRLRIEKAVKDTGIVINDDDTPEEKAKKQEKINKILGLNNELKGTNASKDTGFKSRLNRMLHSYIDANILRVARILDGGTDGVNVQELYRKEDECYTAKTRSMNERVNSINKVMADNNITMDELAKQVKVGDKTFTVDELLFFAAANEDFVEDPDKLAKGKIGIDANDDYAATSRNAVMFGNLFSDTASTEFKEECVREDEEMQRRIDADELTAVERNAQILGELVTRPGTARYIQRCHETFVDIIAAANQLDDKYKALLKAVADDYAEQYERMNEISIREFNSPVHRVKCYVPLVRLESNGDTNVNQVKEDLLAALGQGAGKQWVNKGMTQRRTSMNPLHQKPVQTGLYKTWADSIERTEHFIAYSPYVRELNRVYKSRDAQYTRQFIENRYGKGMVTYIDDYINEVANPNANKIREKGAELLHTLRGKTAPAYLAWKASAIIKQGLTSPWPYMQFVNPAEYAAASWKCITSRGAMYDAIRNKSVFMNNRVMDPMNDLIDEMAEKANQNKFDKAVNAFNKKGMAGLEWIDWVCVAPGWLACYEKKYTELTGKNQDVYEATKQRLEEENYYAEVGTTAWKTPEQIEKLATKAMEDDVETKAVQYADDCTRQCQPSNRSADISPLFKNSSEAMKAYLQFQTSLNVIWQNIRYDIPYAIKKNEFNRVAMTIVGYALAGIFMNSVMEGIGGDDDDDGSAADDRLKNLVYYATTQFTDAVPMIGSELTNTMDKLITGKQQFMNSGTDMTPTLTKMLSILTNARSGNFQKAAEMTAEGIAMFLGLPVSGSKEVKKLLGVGDGDGEIGVQLGNVYGILDPEDYR